MVNLPLKWFTGHTDRIDGTPDEYVAATVPGAVQIDWARAKKMPDWNRDLNFKEYGWMEDCFWVYKTEIPATPLAADELLLFRCKGIDYKYDIFLDGELIYAYEGMFRPFELDVGRAAASGGVLTIVIYPIPKAPNGTPGTRQEASECCKPAVSYGWDWHPRLVPSGIWDDAELRVVNKIRIRSAEVRYTLNGDLSAAAVTVGASVCGCADATDCGLTYRFKLFDPDGGLALETTDIESPFTLANPRLWWCNGYGAPNLYAWELSLEKDGAVIDRTGGKTGFRKISLEMNPGTWEEIEAFPKTRSRAPITITLNNTPVFAKGSNWVNPEMFPGAMCDATYRPLLEYARDANMNIFRVWGGGIVNKESFFDMCDAFGLMVWQEFPLACNKYPDTERYLSVLESEATAIIERLRPHASLAIWCGGNELFNDWSGMTDQSLPLRLLNKLCYEHDKGRPYLPTSPVTGMAHGCYLFVYPDGREVYKAMGEAHFTAYTEFGIPSISNLETCLDATARDKLFPFEFNPVTEAHHAYNAWDQPDTWCSLETIRRYFGEPASLEQLIDWSQWMQCEGYKCIFEEARKQKPYCSMAINWCYNEPWPTIANNSLLNYPARLKPAYFAVSQSCRNQLASARIPRFSWKPGDDFTAELWLLNDGASAIAAGAANVYLEYGGVKRFVLRWDYEEAPANVNLAGPVIRHRLAAAANGADGCKYSELTLVIEAGNLSSAYKLIISA